MPDGNAYEFQNDFEATRAMKAWHKQFSAAPSDDGPAMQTIKELPERFGSAVSAVGRTAGSLVGLVPQLGYGLGNALVSPMTGENIDQIMANSEEANPMTHINKALPPNEFTRQSMDTIGQGFDKAEEVGGNLVRIPLNALGIAGVSEDEAKRLGIADSKAQAAERSIAGYLGNFIPAGGKLNGKPFFKKGEKAPELTKSKLDAVDAEMGKAGDQADAWKEINALDAQLNKGTTTPYNASGKGKSGQGRWTLDENGMPVKEELAAPPVEAAVPVSRERGVTNGRPINETPEELAFWRERANQMTEDARNTPIPLEGGLKGTDPFLVEQAKRKQQEAIAEFNAKRARESQIPIPLREGEQAMGPYSQLSPKLTEPVPPTLPEQPGRTPFPETFDPNAIRDGLQRPGPEPVPLVQGGIQKTFDGRNQPPVRGDGRLSSLPDTDTGFGFEPNRAAPSVGAGLVEALKRQREEGAGGFPFKDRISHLTDDPAAQMLLRELDQRLSEARRGEAGAAWRARELEAQLANHGFDANHPWTTGEKNAPPVQHSTARNGLSVFDKSNKALPIERSGTRNTRLTPSAGRPFDPNRNSIGRFMGKKQGGMIHPELQTFGVIGLLDKVKGMSDGASRVLSRFIGTFGKEQLVAAKRKSLDPRGTERLVWMRPATFHSLAMARDFSRKQFQGMSELKREEIRKGLQTEEGLNDRDSIPQLGIRIDERGVAKVEEHEGRHRMDVFAEKKLDRIPVLIKSIDKKLRNADPLPALEQEYGNTQYQAGYIKDVFPQDPANAAQRYPGSENGPIMMGNGVPLPDFLQKGLDRVGKAASSVFEKNASLQSAVKGLPAAINSVYDGITQQGTNAAEVLAKNADFNKDITNKAKIAGKTVVSGANIMAKVEKNPFIRSAYEMFDQSNKLALKAIDALVHPAMTIAKEMSKQERMDVVALMMKYEGKQRVTPEVMQKAGYGEKEIAFYNALTKAQDAALVKINEARVAIGKEPLSAREGFMASTFRGAFKTIVRDKNDKPVYVLSENTRWGHDSLVKEFQAKFGKDFKFETFDPKNYEKFRSQENQADFFYKRFMQDVLKDDPRAMAMDELFKEWKTKQAEFELGHNQHAKAKSETAVGGAEGLRFEKDVWQNAQDYIEAQLRYIENSFVWSEHQKAYKSAGELIEGIKKRLPNTADYMDAYRDQAIGARRNAIGRLADNIANETNPYMVQQASSWAKATLNGLLLGGPTNMAFMATQLLQTINALPEMMSVSSRLNKSQIKALAFDAPMAYTKVVANLARNTFTAGDPAVQWAKQNHVIKAARWEGIDELHQGKASAAFGKVWNGGVKATDLGGRGITYLAFVNLFKKHFKGEELYRMAADATERTMTDYRGFETPMGFESGGFIGQTSGFLHKYPANWVNQLVGFAKTKEFAPMVALLGTSFFTAGVSGMIGINTYEAMAHIFGWPSVKEYLFKSGAPTWVTMGPLSTVKIPGTNVALDFQAKTSMADIIPDNALDVILPGAGFVTNIVGKIKDEKATKTAVAHAATPASLKGVFENAFLSQKRPDGNINTINPGDRDAEYVRTPDEAMLRNFGFRSTKESLWKQQKFAYNQSAQREFKQEVALLVRLKEDVQNGTANPFALRKASDELVAKWRAKGLDWQGLDGKITKSLEEAFVPEDIRNLKKAETAPEKFIKQQRIRHGE
jgi:hypothetical protein